MATAPGNVTLNKETIEWAYNTLLSLGFTLKSNVPEKVQDTPWSCVMRFITDQGIIYLKQTPEQLALEAPITQVLYTQFQAPVPEVIAHHTELHCFLMKDAGRPLREILRKKFDVNLFSHAMEQFSLLQMAVADRIDAFFDMGVPDWRLDKLPNLYMQLLSQKEILLADGLSEVDIDELEAQQSKVSSLCKQLSDYAIQETLVQCDFHDNNILIEEQSQNITFIDLGEIVISHPFFSLVGCLRQVITHHTLTDKDEAYLHLMDAYFKNYINIESKGHLLDALKLAQVLWCIYEALAQYRLRLACDPTRFMLVQRHGKLSGRLKEFMSLIHLC
jgi:aminoglycoside/choline kinase family phosphotransferase